MAKDNRVEIKTNNVTFRTNDVSNLYVNVETDVSDAVKGFKALQREIRETTKALREYEAVSNRMGEATKRGANDNGDSCKSIAEKGLNLTDYCGSEVCYCGNKCGNNAKDIL